MAVAPSFLVPPTVPPPGLQEVVEIQNKIRTKSNNASAKLRRAPPDIAGSKAGLPTLDFREDFYCF